MQKPRILAAGTPDAIEALLKALGNDADVVAAYSVKEALARLDEGGFDTLACNVRFDESRMFEFLQAVMERTPGAALRIVSFRVEDRPLTRSRRDAIRNALEALGVERFVDMAQLRAESGPDFALETLRNMVLGK
jgi:hypothetical protein